MIPDELQQDFQTIEADETVKGTSVRFTLHGNGVQLPDFAAVTNVAVVAFADSDNIVAVELRRGVDVPGGHKEPGDTTILDIAKREVMEEACVTLKAPYFVAAIIESNYYSEPSYMLVLVCAVDELQVFEPLHESFSRELIAPSEFLERYKAGSTELMAEIMRRSTKISEQLFTRD